MVEIAGVDWGWNLNYAQALMLILGFARRNHVPDPKEKGKGRGGIEQFMSDMNSR